MSNYKNDDVKKMLEMLREQTESNDDSQSQIETQTTENIHTDEDIKNMLKECFSSETKESSFDVVENYSYDNVEEFISEEMVEEVEEIEEIIEEENEPQLEAEAENPTIVEKIPTSPIDVLEEIESLDENDDVFSETVEVDENDEFIQAVKKGIENLAINSNDKQLKSEMEIPQNYIDEEDEPLAEESINYDEVLEGQQGTVFNQFVEDFTGDLDDVVFEAEITESRAPDKQYTIFEDWQQIIKEKDFATAEEDIIPPTDEEFEQSEEINESKKMHTDYFNPIVSDNDLDAVDIALMVALGGESELNQTVGFEKIRQAVHDAEEKEEENLEGKKIFGFCGDEYSSIVQNIKIKKKYRSDKIKLLCQVIGTVLLTLVLMIYEIFGWIGKEFKGVLDIAQHPTVHVLTGFMLLVVCFIISINKVIRLFKEPLRFSSLSYIGALLTLFLSVLHDVLIIFIEGYASSGLTFHLPAAILLSISILYDWFDYVQQAYMFNIVSLSDKKLVLEPYGKIKTDDDSEMIESDSYCISRVPTVKKYFARTSAPTTVSMSKLIPLVLSFSIAICVMLLLLLMEQGFFTILFGFVITLSVLLICTSIFESEVAFFTVYMNLKKYKTGIVGKSSVAEYGNCKTVYFDDFNVFNKKSVRTKGLKLYDNNEIYRILYHTQAVFSKVGGPLKGVFEFATTEMTHSNKVEIKEISKEGISAIVDGRTAVLIGTGSFMRSRYIHPSYTGADLKLEESGEESIMFIALNGVLGAKLYVTYQFSSEFERLARKLTARGVNIGIRSSDPNINNKWAKKYGEMKKCSISIVRPTLKEIKPSEKSIDSGVVSVKNVRALSEALMMCIKLNRFESLIAKIRVIALILMGILSFALILLSGINIMMMLSLALSLCLGASIMFLLTYFYIKN